MFNIKIEDNLQLNYLNQKYAKEIFDLIEVNRAYLRQWLVWVDQTKQIEDTKKWIQKSLDDGAKGKALQTTIMLNDSIVGNIGFNKIDKFNKKGEIGYWLSQNQQGKGIMSKSVSALLDYGLNFLELNRIEIKCAVENNKSRAIPERLGFRLEGILKEEAWLNDRFVDHALYSLLKSEYQDS
ncbi:GNAT family N-acetyltransferase [Candidatus Dojkabacteria bacterium]|nr:GNAT family N-acetyltransferase [Candidatus Dojkabacteria bacterium]